MNSLRKKCCASSYGKCSHQTVGSSGCSTYLFALHGSLEYLKKTLSVAQRENGYALRCAFSFVFVPDNRVEEIQ